MINQLLDALVNLFQACADLPLEEMNRMEKEINDASVAIKAAQQLGAVDVVFCMCNPNEAPYKIGSKLCAVCEKPRR